MSKNSLQNWVSILMVSFLGACSTNPDIHNDEEIPGSSKDRKYKGVGKFLGEDALIVGPSKAKEDMTMGIGVNSFLWRATLDTVSFMPLKSVDPFGGVILTDWYAPPGSSGERFKMDVMILDRHLSADGVRVSVFRQVLKDSSWIDEDVDPAIGEDIEEAILTKARQFKINE